MKVGLSDEAFIRGKVPMTKQARPQGIPIRETKQSSPASHQASPIKTPPSTNQSRLNKKRKKDMWVSPDS